jgi:hypothetical protein
VSSVVISPPLGAGCGAEPHWVALCSVPDWESNYLLLLTTNCQGNYLLRLYYYYQLQTNFFG